MFHHPTRLNQKLIILGVGDKPSSVHSPIIPYKTLE